MVLIVEDEPLLALDLEMLLADAGYGTVTAGSLAEAQGALTRCKPDVAIVDMRLRDGLSGPAVARCLDRCGVPVIIHSGEWAIAAGVPAVAHVPKPAPRGAILAQVRLVVRH